MVLALEELAAGKSSVTLVALCLMGMGDQVLSP